MNNYEKEEALREVVANRGKRYYRNQKIWEVVEGVVCTVLVVLTIIGVMAVF